MRIVFMGTPEFSVPVLQALVDAGHDVVAAYSQPARRSGRGKAVTPSPVQARAEALGIAVRTPMSLKGAEAQAELAAFGADVAVVAAYGLILPRAVLEAPVHGCLNVHASLLPRWRGAAPIQRAILAGDAETGVGIMQMEAGLDTGPVRLEGRTPVGSKTAGELTGELSAMGARLMAEVLGDLAAYPAMAQIEDGVSYAPKIDKAEARLDFGQGAAAVERRVRAFNPPGAWFEVAGERVRVLSAETSPAPTRHPSAPTRHPSEGWEIVVTGSPSARGDPSLRWGDGGAGDGVARGDGVVLGDGVVGMALDDRLTIACAEGSIRPTLLQRAGRGVMSADELLRGFPIPAGTTL